MAVRRVRQGKDKLRRFFQTGYQAKTWSRERKIIARVEATARGTDVRFAVTNVGGRAKLLYDKIYCARGRMENMIKEHKLYTKSDRTSCHRWEANQFRLFLHTGAYWLLHQLRQAAPRRSPWRTATFETLRRAFLKIAVRIEELGTRVKSALPSAYPYRKAMISMAGCIAAQGPGSRRPVPPDEPQTSPSNPFKNPPRKPPSTRPISLASLKSCGDCE